ncbi:MAG: DUF4091 domain-containing protein [Planctomycetes bacterium]|nr:DUF4091 domain-containing protein [Planctomycetota bacterium]
MRRSAAILAMVLGAAAAVPAAPAGPARPVIWTESATRKVFLDAPPGEGRAIDLAAARNEWESAQIVLRVEESAPPVPVRATSLEGPGGARIPEEAIGLFRVAYVPVPYKGKAYPDPLPPLRGPIALEPGKNAPILVTIRVPKDAKPGDYRGAIRVADASIPVALRVWPFEIPDKPSVHTAFGISMDLAYPFEGVDPKGPDARRMHERYYEFLVAHRLSPYNIPCDILDPEAGRFIEDPRVTDFIIPYADDVDAIRKRVDRAREKGWLSKAYFYPWDEPVNEEQYRRLRQCVEKIRSVDPKLRIVSPFYRDAESGKSAYDALDGLIDIWCSVSAYFKPDRMEEKRKKGEEVWWYVCCGPGSPYANLHLTMDSVDHRILPWQMVKYRIEGFLYWSTTYWNREHIENPWTNMVTVPFINKELSGDGSLLYPGRLPSGERVAEGPVASLRLLNLRDGLEDLEMLALLARREGRPAVEGAVAELVRSLTDFARDPREIERVRRRIGERLAGPIIIENDAIRLAFDRTTGAWVDIADKASGRSLAAAPGPSWPGEIPDPVVLEGHALESGSAPRLRLRVRGGSWICEAEYVLRGAMIERRFTIANAVEERAVLRGATYELPTLAPGSDAAVVFPGTLPVGDQPVSRIERGGSIEPRSSEPLAFLWSPSARLGAGVWFHSEDEYARVTARRSDADPEGGNACILSHRQAVIAPLEKGKRAVLGTQSIWIARGSRDEILRSVGAAHERADLRAPARALPDLRGRIIYCGHPGGMPEKGFRGYGGFRALESYLPTLEKMGIDVLWLLPIFEHGDGKKWNLYSPFDPFRISPLYGTEGEFARLVRTGKASGIDTILDLVPHGPPDHTPLGKGHPEWVCRTEDGKPTYVWGQLAFDNALPGWQDYNARVAAHHARTFGVAGARIDVAAGSPPNWAATYRPSHSTLGGGLGMCRAIREGFLRERPDVLAIPEEYTGASIFHGVGDLCYDAQLFFLMVDLQERGASPEEWASSLQRFLHDQRLTLPPGAVKMRWTANHDTVSWTFQKKRTREAYGLDRSRALLALCALIDGVPMLYQGEEDPALYGGAGESNVEFIAKVFGARRRLAAIRSAAADYAGVSATGGVFACSRGESPDLALVLVRLATDPMDSIVRLPETLQGVKAWRDELNGERFAGGEAIRISMQPLARVLVPAEIVVRWDTAVLRLDEAGRAIALDETATGRNRAAPGQPFCEIQTDAGALAPVAARGSDGGVLFEFPGGATLSYRISSGASFSLWDLDRIDGIDPATIRSIRHCRIDALGPGTLGNMIDALYDDAFAVAVMGTRINVHAHPAGQGKTGDRPTFALVAESGRAHGISPAGFGIIACPRAGFEDAIEAFEKAAGRPSRNPGGIRGKRSAQAERSYLFITGFGEKDADDVIRWAKRGGFHTILIGGDCWSRTHGHHEINARYFPDGLPSLVRTAARIRRAGFGVGLHFLAAAVYLNDPYVTPVPDPHLVEDAGAEIAGDVDEKADFIPTAEAPAGFPAEDGGYTGKGTIIRIGDELIQYGEIRSTAPFGFARCRRGACGTRAAAHAKGGRIAHLLRSYGYFLFDLDLDGTLAEEVIGNVCRVANAIDSDMLYFDGSERLQGDHWYYNAKLQSMYYDRLKRKDILLQGSSYSPYSWHLISRMASADGHGDVKRYLDERMGWFRNYEANLMPLDIGWYYVYDPAVTADQFDYILQKCLGFGASISVQTNPSQLRTHPEMGAIFDLVSAYEGVRLTGRLSEEARALLREPGREYRLLRDPLRLRRTRFGPWREVGDLDGKQNVWDVEPMAPGARLGFQVRCGALSRPGPSYRSSDAVVLETFDDLAPYPAGAAATNDGVTQEFRSVDENPVEGARCGRYSATSARADAGGWSVVAKRFDPPLDLSAHAGIGFWLRGDGKGGLFKLQLRDPRHATDTYIRNDFTEWRYLQLPRPEKPQPEPVDYTRIASLLFYYNGLPAGASVTCWIDDVKALRTLDAARILHPALRSQGGSIESEATVEEGRSREFPPAIAIAGETRVTFSATEPMTGRAQVRTVQDIPEEIELESRRIRGTVRCDGTPLAGVQVSDGYRIVRTNVDGEYELVIGPRSGRFVSITTPSGYWTDDFYAPVAEAVAEGRADFALRKVEQPDRFDFAFITDMHVDSRKVAATKLRASLREIDELRPAPAFLWAQGDICLQGGAGKDYVEAIALAAMPVRNGAGNHEMMMKKANPREDFETFFGPTYYSFDWGSIHCIVLDGNKVIPGEEDWRAVHGAVEGSELAWLRADLAAQAKGKTIIVGIHIPIVTTYPERRRESPPDAPYWEVTNRETITDLFAEYGVRLVLQGHMHENERAFVGGVEYASTISLSGSWWGSGAGFERGVDGCPRGYRIVSVDGTAVTHRYQSSAESRVERQGEFTGLAKPVARAADVPIVFNAYDAPNGSTAQVRIDEGPWQPMPAFAEQNAKIGLAMTHHFRLVADTTALAPGEHTIAARVRFPDGTVVTETAKWTVAGE